MRPSYKKLIHSNNLDNSPFNWALVLTGPSSAVATSTATVLEGDRFCMSSFGSSR